MAWRAVSDAAVKWIGLGAAVAGAAYGLFELTDLNRKQVDERKLRSLAYAQQFASQDYFAIRRNIYRHFIACEGDCASNRLDSSEAFAFVEFFDIVLACVRADTCDASLARDFFTPYANGHWHCMRTFIEKTRGAEPNSTTTIRFGDGLEFFKTWEKPIAPCAPGSQQ